MRLHKLAFVASSVFVLLFSMAPVLADDVSGTPPSTGGGVNTTTATTAEPTSEGQGNTHQPTGKTEPNEVNSNAAQDGSGKLSATHLQSCEARQSSINTILSHIVTRGQNQLTLFTTIAARVEAFATSKNLTVPNYSTLVATLQADNTKAATDIAALKTGSTINCTGTNPKGMVSQFKSALQTEISDLKTYKTDVRNLIVAVKTAAGETTTTDTGKPSSTSPAATTGGN